MFAPALSAFCPLTSTWPARINARAFSRESVRPRSTTRTSRRLRVSGTPMHDEIRDLAQALSAFVERPQSQVRGQALFFGHLAGPLQAVDRGKRDFVLFGVLSRSFSEGFGRLLHIQNVVDNLKRQADVFPVTGQCAELVVIGARINSAHTQAGAEQGTGLGTMNGFE